jgi:hypothetical protein
MNTILYNGTGSSNSITGVGFQPDMVWLKSRSNGNYHNLQNAISGANKVTYPNDTNAEATSTTRITYFNSDGFTVGTESDVNGSGRTYVSWNWKANGAGSSNTDGDITSTVSANTTAGFSIAKFTASGGTANKTVGHGLNAVPKVVIVKHLSTTGGWQTYFEGIGTANQQLLTLNGTTAIANYSNLWGAGMTNSVIGIGVNTAVSDGQDCIAYSFAEKTGYSKFGSYIGNGNADGSFIYCGFKPAWLMVKNINNASADWTMFDIKRNTFNIMDKRLRANLENAEDAPLGFIDFTSNGFKWRTDSFAVNGSGNTHVFMAFAEAPLVGTNNIPATAR